MAKCMIFVFSGTGNTAAAAGYIKDSFIEKGVEAEVLNIDELNDCPDLTGYDYVGMGFPVYAFAMPAIVEKFTYTVPMADPNQKAFVFATYGEKAVYAIVHAVNVFESKHYKILSSRGFKMPPNFTPSKMGAAERPSEAVVESLFKKAKSAAAVLVDDVLAGKTDVESSGWVFGDIFSRIAGNTFKNFMAPKISKMYKVKPSCTSCYLCYKSCPVNNIEIYDEMPRFLDHCIACCRCYNICPVKAITSEEVPEDDYRYTAPGYTPPLVNPFDEEEEQDEEKNGENGGEKENGDGEEIIRITT